MKITLLSESTQATLAAALACYRNDANQAGNVEAAAQIAAAEAELSAIAEGPKIALAAKAAGVVYTDFVNHGYGEEPGKNPFVEAARGYYPDGIEFDDRSVISQGPQGAYVSCWYWVSNSQAGIPEISELLEEMLGFMDNLEQANPAKLSALADPVVLKHQRLVIEDLVVNLHEDLDDLCGSEICLPESLVHKVYRLVNGEEVQTFPSCILKELSAVAEVAGFDAVKVGHIGNWIHMNGRKLDHMLITL